MDTLEQENSWLARKLRSYEEQLQEGEEANHNLYNENQILKEVRGSLTQKVDELSSQLEQLRSGVSDGKNDKEFLRNRVSELEQRVRDYRREQEAASVAAEEAKLELEKAHDVITNNMNEMEELQLYVRLLEEKTIEYQNEAEQASILFKNKLGEKEAELATLLSKIEEYENSKNIMNFNQDGGESAACILKEFSTIDGPVNQLTQVDADGPANDILLSLKMRIKTLECEMQDMAMRMETLSLEKEILVSRYQEKVSDLECILEKRSSTHCIQMFDKSTSISDDCTSDSSVDYLTPLLPSSSETEQQSNSANQFQCAYILHTANEAVRDSAEYCKNCMNRMVSTDSIAVGMQTEAYENYAASSKLGIMEGRGDTDDGQTYSHTDCHFFNSDKQYGSAHTTYVDSRLHLCFPFHQNEPMTDAFVQCNITNESPALTEYANACSQCSTSLNCQATQCCMLCNREDDSTACSESDRPVGCRHMESSSDCSDLVMCDVCEKLMVDVATGRHSYSDTKSLTEDVRTRHLPLESIGMQTEDCSIKVKNDGWVQTEVTGSYIKNVMATAGFASTLAKINQSLLSASRSIKILDSQLDSRSECDHCNNMKKEPISVSSEQTPCLSGSDTSMPCMSYAMDYTDRSQSETINGGASIDLNSQSYRTSQDDKISESARSHNKLLNSEESGYNTLPKHSDTVIADLTYKELPIESKMKSRRGVSSRATYVSHGSQKNILSGNDSCPLTRNKSKHPLCQSICYAVWFLATLLAFTVVFLIWLGSAPLPTFLRRALHLNGKITSVPPH